MRTGSWLAAGLLTVAALGCSTSSIVPTATDDRFGPHRGVLVTLPGGKGYAEVVNSEPEGGKARGASRPPVKLVVYLLTPGLDAPASATVSDMTVKLTTLTDKPETLTLTTSPDDKDKLGKARFASKAGPYYLSNAQGELSATVDGAPMRATFEGALQR
jgi:hypothetical protein